MAEDMATVTMGMAAANDSPGGVLDSNKDLQVVVDAHPKLKFCQTDNGWRGTLLVKCVHPNGLPYFVVILTLVLCALLLATIALIVIILIFKRKRKGRTDSVDSEAQIGYASFSKPCTRAMEVQPDLRSLEPRSADPRDRANFVQFGQFPGRRFLALPLEGQRRLIPVPEEESGAEDTCAESPEPIDGSETEPELDSETMHLWKGGSGEGLRETKR